MEKQNDPVINQTKFSSQHPPDNYSRTLEEMVESAILRARWKQDNPGKNLPARVIWP